MIEIHVAHHRAHAGDRQLDDAANQVVHFINCFDWIGDLPIDHRIDVNRNVVAGDHRLRRQVEILFAQIDRSDARSRVGPVNRARLIKERYQNIQPARRNLAEASQPLNQHHRRLRHDLDCL